MWQPFCPSLAFYMGMLLLKLWVKLDVMPKACLCM